ncbi:hypothetical protein AXG93_4225s1040 [Marchantia polymorpha subsp. ruderalis]|uniref:Secreted protein n=1 Tax=Marchantia polymorpha subsp. ruderalis TaxID=1480154 RepID=A0A176WT77_MARPO|nr:hypothetical protein AXG93_4225s1040 [Marchantia polymorpha subsp. ruderalis]
MTTTTMLLMMMMMRAASSSKQQQAASERASKQDLEMASWLSARREGEDDDDDDLRQSFTGSGEPVGLLDTFRDRPRGGTNTSSISISSSSSGSVCVSCLLAGVRACSCNVLGGLVPPLAGVGCSFSFDESITLRFGLTVFSKRFCLDAEDVIDEENQ